MTKQALINRVIETTVHEYFCEYTMETYTGRTTTGDLLSVVTHTLDEFGFPMDEHAIGETLDQIRLQGPTGECDEHWLNVWCGDDQPTVGDLIKEWGMIA